VRSLLTAGADTNVRTGAGEAPLVIASKLEQVHLVWRPRVVPNAGAVTLGQDMVTVLLAHGADVGAKAASGLTVRQVATGEEVIRGAGGGEGGGGEQRLPGMLLSTEARGVRTLPIARRGTLEVL